MKLIVGLGNPGEKYEKTRHNAGFLAVDKMADNFQFPSFEFRRTFNAEISQDIIGSEKVILVKPQTFMNNSGEAVKAILDYYKIGPESVIVIHDDLDIAIGEDFTRARIGIGIKYVGLAVLFKEEDHKKIPVEKFVLQRFSDEEMLTLEKILDEIANNIADLFEE